MQKQVLELQQALANAPISPALVYDGWGLSDLLLWRNPNRSWCALGGGLYCIHFLRWAQTQCTVPGQLLAGICYAAMFKLMFSFSMNVIRSSRAEPAHHAAAFGKAQRAARHAARVHAIQHLVWRSSSKLQYVGMKSADKVAHIWGWGTRSLGGEDSTTTLQAAAVLWTVAKLSEMKMSIYTVGYLALIAAFVIPAVYSTHKQQIKDLTADIQLLLIAHYHNTRNKWLVGSTLLVFAWMVTSMMTRSCIILVVFSFLQGRAVVHTDRARNFST